MYKIIFLAILLAFSVTSNAVEVEHIQANTSASKCDFGCAAVTVIGDKSYVVAKDLDGNVFEIIPVNIPKNAVLMSNSVVLNGDLYQQRILEKNKAPSPEPRQLTNNDGSYTEVTVQHYRTDDEFITVVTVIFKDADGNILDVQVQLFRTGLDGPNPQN